MTTISIDSDPPWRGEISPGLSPDTCVTITGPAGGGALARCALWWNESPPEPDDPSRRIGAIGQFHCVDRESGRRVLDRACEALRDAGCARAAAPLDGDTWHSYRCLTGGEGSAPRFLLEPWNGPEPVDALRAAGFAPWARYSSSRIALESVDTAARWKRVEDRARRHGVLLRRWNPDRAESELDRLFALSKAAFRDNFLYTPISRESFLALYRPAVPLVSPEFVLLAERGDETVGFVFALPDTCAPEGKRLVVKTLAVHPSCRRLGLGALLVHRVQEAARKAGFREAIHALQYEDNASLQITARQAGEPIRSYTLFHRFLTEP